MTRLLSDILGVSALSFGQHIRQLERACGEPNADIRLTTELMHRTRSKIRDLGLDPQDTTGRELYQALCQRLLDDEQRLRAELGLTAESSSVDVLTAVVQLSAKLEIPRNCFALRNSVAKRLLKKLPPKKTMAQLGYRSVDSMIKHEPVAQIYVASMLYESPQWHKAYFQQYDGLHPSDFESRELTVIFPQARRWEKVAAAFAVQHRHHSVVCKELGAIVVLPVKADVPALALSSLLLILDGVNAIRCSSTYLKMQQLSMGFGANIRTLVNEEPTIGTIFAGQPLPWRFVQNFFHAVREAYHPALFEPHVQPEDLELARAEVSLAREVPALEFWEDTSGLAYVHQGQAVSMNMLDVALNAANSLEFEQRILHHVRTQVWSNVISRYLQHRNADYLVEQLIPQPETVQIESEVLV